METTLMPQRAQYLNNYLYDMVAYLTLTVGYLLSILQARHLTLGRFLAITALNGIWLVAYCWQSPSMSKVRCIWTMVILCATSILAMLATHWGVEFDWLLPIVTIGVTASILDIKTSLLTSGALMVVTLTILL